MYGAGGVVGDKLIDELHQTLLMVAKHLITYYEWAELVKVYAFNTTTATSYPLPGDFDRILPDTAWASNSHLPQVGPLTPQQWQNITQGTVAVGPAPQFRIFGATNNQFQISPGPAAGEGRSFEYISRNWVYPPAWTTGVAVTTGDYRSYNGNIYQSGTTGTTGATPPTWTTGTDTDGTVNWTYVPYYPAPTSDADIPVFDHELLILGLQTFFLGNNGMSTGFVRPLFDRMVSVRSIAKRGSSSLIALPIPTPNFSLLNACNIPDSGYGG